MVRYTDIPLNSNLADAVNAALLRDGGSKSPRRRKEPKERFSRWCGKLRSVNPLLVRPKLAWGWTLTDEQRLSVALADTLRNLSADGKLKGTWFHVPNEGKRHNITGAILKAMGVIPGVGDYVFIWASGGGYIELKVNSQQSEYQWYWQLWCELEGVPYAIARSIDEVLEHLREWGALDDN